VPRLRRSGVAPALHEGGAGVEWDGRKFISITCDWAKHSRDTLPRAIRSSGGGMFQVLFAMVAILGATIHIVCSAKRRSSTVSIAATYLIYLLVIYVGVMGVFTAWAHVFQPMRTSASIGWATSPYEYEVGMADLTVGVLGVLCLRFRGNFWLATAIANAVWLLGDAIGHIREMTLHGNHARNNSGVFLGCEIAVPVIILILVAYTRRAHVEKP